jgi:hypothetical protein
VICKSALPNGEFRCETVREAALDKTHHSFECDALRRDDEVNMIGHNDEGVKLVMPGATIVLEGFQKEFGVGGKLEETATIRSR